MTGPGVRIARYAWEGHDAQGHPQRGVLQATHAEMVRAQLERAGVTVVRVRRQWRAHPPRIAPATVAITTRQWATLLQAGLSLVSALRLLERSATHTGMALRLQQVRRDLEEGLPLSGALSRHPECFDALYVGMVHAGETAGILDTMMLRLADTLEKNDALRERLRSALTYPAVVSAIAAAALLIILLHVVPVFEEVFASFGGELPLATRLVLTLSQTLRHGVFWTIALALLLGLLWRWHRRPQDWQRQWQRRALDWPALGPLVRSAVLARWAHTLSALLAAGVPLTEALPVVGEASGHAVYERINQHLKRRVAEGGKLSEGMAHTGRFPEMLVAMCAIGEETGALEELLARSAALMAAELETRLQALTRLLEPLIIVVLGTAIGVILVAMYLPIFRLGQIF